MKHSKTHKDKMEIREEDRRNRRSHIRVRTGKYLPRLEDEKHLKKSTSTSIVSAVTESSPTTV